MSYIPEIQNFQFDSKIFSPSGFLGDLSPDKNFTLKLYLRVCLLQKNPPAGKDEFTVLDANGTPFKCTRWSEADWVLFKQKYVEQANYWWDKAFLLMTPPTYSGFDWKDIKGETKRRNVICHFYLSLSETPNNCHAVIPVVKTQEAGFRSHSKLYSAVDVEPEIYTDIERVRKSFFTAPHEVGHLLNLGHPNEASLECLKKRNSAICYVGNTDHALRTMGTGTMLSLDDASPWRRRVAAHTKTNFKDWKAAYLSNEAVFRGAEYVDLVVH